MGFLQLIDPEYRDLVAERNRARLAGEIVPSRYELKLRTKRANECWIDFTAGLIEYDGKPAVLGIAFDITERRSTEERLRQREIELAHVARLTTMGEMVAGIAHEINQPLSAISNFAEACSIGLREIEDTRIDPIRKWTAQIGQQAVRCGDIIRRLRSYVRRKKTDETSVSVNDVINGSIALLRNEIRQSAISVECDLTDANPSVRGNPVELQQVVVNLLANALEAMKNSDENHRKLIVRSVIVDEYVRIAVEDSGHGIRSAEFDRLFEAFFTTKSDGMGMGLAISRSIIERHDGHLWAQNKDPRGAAFHVELPASTRSRLAGPD